MGRFKAYSVIGLEVWARERVGLIEGTYLIENARAALTVLLVLEATLSLTSPFDVRK